MSSIDDFFAELAELEKQKDTPPPPNPDLRVPFSFIEVGKSELFEIRPQKAPPAENTLIDVTTVCDKHQQIPKLSALSLSKHNTRPSFQAHYIIQNPLPLGAQDTISIGWLKSEYLDLQPTPTSRENLHKVQRYPFINL